MSEKKLQNSVRFVGYLKETTLEERVSQKGRKFIMGNITVALDEFNVHRVRFLMFEDQGKERYEALTKFLPDNAMSVARYLKTTPTANFAVASSMAAKVWVMAEFEEFVSRSGEKERIGVTLQGRSIGYCDENKTFVPTADFDADVYIESIEDELDGTEEDAAPTGRVILNGIIPAYKGLVYKASFIVPSENNGAKFIKEKYKAGDSISLHGNLIAMRVQVEKAAEEELEDSWGGSDEQQYTTRFVRERRVTKGHRIDAVLSAKEVKDGLAQREVLMDKNGQRRSAALAAREEKEVEVEEVEEATAEVTSSKSATENEDFDF